MTLPLYDSKRGVMESTGAVVSSDHADEDECVRHLASDANRVITPDEVRKHNGKAGATFWAVVDGFVVDATDFVNSHPGGLKKLLSTDAAGTGATGSEFGFSFSRGRNAHFPQTGKSFSAGVKRFLAGAGAEVEFRPHGTLVILGRLRQS